VMLFADIDLDDLGVVDGNNWTAVSNFKGIFDGNGFTISNLKINKPTENNQGLFGIASGAVIKNVNLENVNTTGNARVGGLVGYNTNTEISNCTVNGNITGNDQCVGGLIGWSTGEKSIIKYCKSNCKVVSTCYNTGAGTRVGGLVGQNILNSKILYSSSTGTVEGIELYIGGLVGLNGYGGIVSDSYSIANVTAQNYGAGGLVGGEYDGGLIKNSYACGKVLTAGGIYNGGGLIGSINKGSIENCFYDKETSGCNDTGGTGLTTAEMKNIQTYINAGWDIGAEGSSNTAWSISNGGYPELQFKSGESKSINLQVGINSDESSVISFDAGLEIGYFKLNLTSEKRARESLDKIDSLLSRFTTKISELGAIENRLDSVYQSNEIQSRNLIAAMSSIKDADLAEESSTYIKSKILSDVTASLLTTANQFPSMALSLIQGVRRF